MQRYYSGLLGEQKFSDRFHQPTVIVFMATKRAPSCYSHDSSCCCACGRITYNGVKKSTIKVDYRVIGYTMSAFVLGRQVYKKCLKNRVKCWKLHVICLTLDRGIFFNNKSRYFSCFFRVILDLLFKNNPQIWLKKTCD